MARRPINAPYQITTEFGVADGYAKFGRHSGTDYAVNLGRPVYAPASGSLQNVVSPTGGNMVVIYDGQFWHRLMHNSAFVRSNGSVQEGNEVAKAGTTGLSTGVHVHWDINSEGIYPTSFAAFKDPFKWLQGGYTPPAPAPTPSLSATQRKLNNPTGVNQRSAASTSASIIKEWALDKDPVFNFKGFVRGEAVNGNNIWFVGANSGGYFSSVAFEGGANTAGLPDLTPAKPTTPVTPPKDELSPVFTKELACVTSVERVHTTNYEVGNFPAKPTGVVLHDFGTDGKDTLNGSLAHFKRANTTAPHFVVSGKQIIQTGKLSWRMYHAGALGNDKIGVEIDPDVDTNIDTKNSVLTLNRELDAMNSVLTRYLHSQFMATSCGDDVQKANLLIPPQAPVTPDDKPIDSTELDKLGKRVTALETLVNKIADFLASIFSGFKK